MWYQRIGSPRAGFHYVTESGRRLRDQSTLARIDALRIPPAWRDVHVARSPARAIQAWGFDSRGRKQYRYHARAVERRELRKYHRVRHMGKSLPDLRRRLHADSHRAGYSRDRVAAIVVRLIAEAFFRVGGERYLRENATHGITTIRKKHLTIDKRTARFRYRGKGSVAQRQTVVAPDLVRLLRPMLRTPGSRLFRYRGEEGEWCDLTERDLSSYVRRLTASRYKPKDFRTWGGSLRAATVLADLGPSRSVTEAKRAVALTMRLVGAELGNTPAVCRSSYVHPMIVARYIDSGETMRPSRANAPSRSQPASGRTGWSHSADEKAFIAFLDRHFPDRRRRERPAA